MPQQEIRKRLLYMLHVGFVEVRNLAQAAGTVQIADLADAMEVLPRLVENCTDEELELVRSVLKNYQDKYPDTTYDLPTRFEKQEVPEAY
jgi:hypothetical protein